MLEFEVMYAFCLSGLLLALEKLNLIRIAADLLADGRRHLIVAHALRQFEREADIVGQHLVDEQHLDAVQKIAEVVLARRQLQLVVVRRRCIAAGRGYRGVGSTRRCDVAAADDGGGDVGWHRRRWRTDADHGR